MSEEAIERLELKLAWLENANEALGEEVYRQQQALEQLRVLVTQLQARLVAMQSEADAPVQPFDPAAERPPHY